MVYDLYSGNPPPPLSFTQADLDQATANGIAIGQQNCKNDPASCGISIDFPQSQAATVAPNLNIHIPTADYQSLTGTMSIWADLQFVSNPDGRFLWELSNFGVNQ